MKLLRLATCDVIVYKDYKIGLKFIFPVCGINLRIHYITCSLINHRVAIHHNIFLKSIPCEFSHYIFQQPLIIHFLVNNLLLSKFIQTRNTRGCFRTKNNLFVPCDGIFDCFLKLFPCFHAVSMGYVQLFCKF